MVEFAIFSAGFLVGWAACGCMVAHHYRERCAQLERERE